MKLPATYRNWISLLGTFIALLSFFSIVLLMLLMTIVGGIYIGLLIYLILPSFLIFGLLLIPFGMMLRARKNRKSKTKILNRWPKIDFEDKATRNAAVIFVLFTTVFVIMTIFGSYKGYHYSESVEFCGVLCHKVMEPEYTAYQNSPHAKVKCVECHVGEGADWMVKAKINGTRQVFKTLLNTYPRPIPTPIVDLRPARETCEKCHWPQKFYSDKVQNQKYYLADSLNTNWNIVLKMKIGADHPAQGLEKGIHWHINPDIHVEYVYSDQKREDIIWVKLTNLITRKVSVYKDQDNMVTDDSLKHLTSRLMDCMDCHNRPSHDYRSPTLYVNNLFNASKIDTAIPFLKKSAMKALNTMTSPKEMAFKEIETQIIDFYKNEHSAVWTKYNKGITKAIPEIIHAYSMNSFPDMKVNYLEYPKHIGHLETKGCFRCHDDNHKTDDGRVISKDCNLCHTIIGQGMGNKMAYSSINEQLEFQHPVDIDNAWKDYNCSECHNVLFP